MKKREVIHASRFFHLVSQQRGHKKWYEIQVCAFWYNVPVIVDHEISDYFGRSQNKYAKTWRFWNRIEAEKQFLYASLRWN